MARTKKLITLSQDKLFALSTAIAKSYAGKFSADTLSRATTFVEGTSNPSRNYVWAILMGTQGKAGKLCDVYSKDTCNSICKLVMYKLSQPQAESVSTDAF